MNTNEIVKNTDIVEAEDGAALNSTVKMIKKLQVVQKMKMLQKRVRKVKKQ